MRSTYAVLGLVAIVILSCRPQTGPKDTVALRNALQQRAGAYPLDSVVFFGRDSALIVFTDSTFTGAKVTAGSWMFGPPVTPAEAGKCPPEKVLGQRIARVLWWRLGADTTLQTVIVRVHGTEGVDRFAHTSMYYYLPQLRDSWVGDTLARNTR